ncbi:hypothetical protein [Campylobacter sp. US33a]|uniref:GGDEF domain-containing protein n=1 Tax=Campylobacter sp. CCS1377 TaxID=3158229 RepID=A0AAU7E7X9_9BACT|nr:hypothetical protein [Campylobacter sp. US33a]TEY04581.1 hypothetical protein ELQ16_00710 [Campylobacter sp. US33a]
MPNINEIARETLSLLRERKLKPTPENYTEIFEELSKKYGLITSAKAKVNKYQSLLMPMYQQELLGKNIRNVDEFLSFLVSRLNMQNGVLFNQFFELVNTILNILKISKDRKIKDMASMSASRISKAMDSEAMYLLQKKWQEFEQKYDDVELENELKKYGIKHEEFSLSIKKLLNQLEQRSYEYFADLLSITLIPSLAKDKKIDLFTQQLLEKPFMLSFNDFKNTLLNVVNKRIMDDNIYTQKYLNFFDKNLKNIIQAFHNLENLNQEHIDFIEALPKDEKGEVKISFEELKMKFLSLNEKLQILNTQINDSQNENIETWGITNELEKMDENFKLYNINYALCIYTVANYQFIMEKYGLDTLNEIFSRFKRILQESCSKNGELWMMDENTYLLIVRGKNKEELEKMIAQNIQTITSTRFIYKQDIIIPKISSFFIDKQSYPSANIYEELLKKIENDNK